MSSGNVIELLENINTGNIGFFEKLTTVADVMTRTVKTLTLDDRLEDAVTFFQEMKVHHAPVIDPEDKDVCGILSDRDVLRATPRYLGKAGEEDGDQVLREDHRHHGPG